MITYVVILLCAAIIPPLALLRVVYKMDRIETEPEKLLMKLFFGGVLCAIPIMILEIWGQSIADIFENNKWIYLFLSYFIIPGFIEEGMKYVVLKRTTWNNPAFNYKFDAIVYAVFASLGFAAIENILYVLDYGIGTAIARAAMAIPAHATFGVIMGAGYTQAKCIEAAGNIPMAKQKCTKSWMTAAIAHGLYDFLIIGIGGIAFYLYFIALIVTGISIAKNFSKNDCPISPFEIDKMEESISIKGANNNG